MADLPDTLLSRIKDDATLVPSLSTPLSSTSPRSDADSRFLSITPLAISTLASLAATAEDRIRLGAATEILKRSPATREQLPTATLSPDHLTAILTPLASILTSIASVASASTPTLASDATEPIDVTPSSPAPSPASPASPASPYFTLQEVPDDDLA